LFGLAVSVIVAAILGRRFSKPIQQIVRFIDHERQSGAPVNDELGYILRHLISLYDETKQLEADRLSRYGALRQAQAHALQAQITPHFLHNTLQAVQWQILREIGQT
jgi:two-component system sensor histidine kinase YesM